MPRAFDAAEAERIRARLYDVGERLFGARGIRRTTVSELARAAGIAKGSFYRFAASKEEFFFDLLEHAEQEVRAEIDAEMRSVGADPAARMRTAVLRASRVLAERPLFRVLLDPAEFALLSRSLPESRLEAHAEGDARYFAELFGPEMARVGSGLLRILVLLPTFERFIGAEVFDEVRDRMTCYVAEGLAREVADRDSSV